MKALNLIFKSIAKITIVITILSTTTAKSLDKFSTSDLISDYFSGILLLNDNKYEQSNKFLKRLNGLETSHVDYSVKYLYSLINSGNFKDAFNYSRKLEKKNLENFESLLITGIHYLKNSQNELASKYFLKAKNKNSNFILNNYVASSLYNWSSLSNFTQAKIELNQLDERFKNLKKIQNIFLNCFFDNQNTVKYFDEIISNQKTDFSRYNYFYAAFEASKGNISSAKKIINSSLELYPRNLLLNQYKKDLRDNKKINVFNCKKEEHVIAEILYITANALSSQSMYAISNFHLNLAIYLNEDFHSYNTLLAENFFEIENLKKAKKIYKNLSKNGEAYNWYSSKQLARILIKENNKDESLKLLKNSYNTLIDKEIYEVFDYAEFLKNNEKFKESIPFYTKVIDQVKSQHPLYPEATDGRGVAYERVGEWVKAEKDLLASLKAKPDQAYVMNYLAYSWIEQGVKIKKSLSMLERANKLKTNDPYITDSLGWALFKLERYTEAKDFLQLAVKLLPADPIVNDHYGDVLWKNGNKIQARYYWDYVLNLEKTEDDLKKIIKKKLIRGL